MPIYEYQCRECSHEFEILQRIGEGADDLDCPQCDQPDLVKQFSTFAANSESPASMSMPAAGGGCGRGNFT